MQILYWGQYTANRLELAEPFYRLFSEILPRCRKDTALLRLGYTEQALRMIEYACDKLSSAGFITGHDAYFLQVDAPPGFSIFLNEMLLQSHGGLIQVFLAIPDTDEPVRFHSLRAQGGFLVTAEHRENRTHYVIVQSLCGNELRLLNPFVNEPDRGVQVKIYRLANDTVLDTVPDQQALTAVIDRIYVPGEIISLPTEQGGIYLISTEIPYFTNVPVQPVN